MPSPSFLVGVSHALGAGGSDGLAFALVFVVGGGVADGLVEADAVVAVADSFEFGGEHGGLCDGLWVGVCSFGVSPQRLDPGLVSQSRGAAEPLGDRAQGHEFSGVFGTHLGPVVGDRQQQRHQIVVGKRGVGVTEAASEVIGGQPSLSSARANRTLAATESGLEARWAAIHLRDTTSTMA